MSDLAKRMNDLKWQHNEKVWKKKVSKRRCQKNLEDQKKLEDQKHRNKTEENYRGMLFRNMTHGADFFDTVVLLLSLFGVIYAIYISDKFAACMFLGSICWTLFSFLASVKTSSATLHAYENRLAEDISWGKYLDPANIASLIWFIIAGFALIF